MDSERTEKYIDWLIAEIGFQSSYHNHKETMAWVATAFYIPGIIVLGYKAPQVHAFWPALFAVLLFTLLLSLVLIFVRTQFDRRSRAADTVVVLMKLVHDICQGQYPIPQESYCLEKGKPWPPFIQRMITEAKGKGRLDWVERGTDCVSYTAIIIATAMAICLLFT